MQYRLPGAKTQKAKQNAEIGFCRKTRRMGVACNTKDLQAAPQFD